MSINISNDNGAGNHRSRLVGSAADGEQNPVAFLRLSNEIGAIETGKRAGLIAIDGELRMLQTWMADSLQYTAPDRFVHALYSSHRGERLSIRPFAKG